ncbi:unnamed protein product [Protopolystoma xenopodis]|uniref:Uncharacterized protein n=1 Tax=Protopolystoma xenopodis TaxID=117903 RepID=A0A3S5C1W9_9PLAT|nr:unnamed protein product [Protopolystoma xenopodis]
MHQFPGKTGTSQLTWEEDRVQKGRWYSRSRGHPQADSRGQDMPFSVEGMPPNSAVHASVSLWTTYFSRLQS